MWEVKLVPNLTRNSAATLPKIQWKYVAYVSAVDEENASCVDSAKSYVAGKAFTAEYLGVRG